MARRAQAKNMTAALAIFVKTPGFSPVKTRLAATLGTDTATRFYQLAAAATAEVVHHTKPDLSPYWAVAESEPAAAKAWSGFPRLWQGNGDLGERLHAVYARLQACHGCALLIGADAPQLTSADLRGALDALRDPDTPFAIGDATDGGFWLFGGREPIPKTLWKNVRYSQAHTASELRASLAVYGGVAKLPTLTDIDTAADLADLMQALALLSDPRPAQRILREWLNADQHEHY
jgi:uncharacterized protein